jgi:hypothetical protein
MQGQEARWDRVPGRDVSERELRRGALGPRLPTDFPTNLTADLAADLTAGASRAATTATAGLSWPSDMPRRVGAGVLPARQPHLLPT